MAENIILLESIKKNEEWLISLRHELHECAEGGFELKKTAKIIERELKNLGIESKTVAKCGVCATLGEGEKCILLRADCDAVMMREESGLPFCASGEYAHACGHDMHTAMLLGAAKFLKENEQLLTQRVKLLFQPAEELLMGAEAAINDGILENPRVDAALSLHVICPAPFDTGTLVVPSAGVGAPAADFFDIYIYGRASHGAASQLAADATAVGARILLSLEELVAKEASPIYESRVTIGAFNSGSAANIISDKCRLSGTLRTLDENERKRLRARITEISERTAEMFGTRAEVKLRGGAPTLINDGAFSEAMYSALVDTGLSVIKAEKMQSGQRAALGGSEDFATISHRVPSLLLGIAAGRADEGYTYPLHHPRVVFDERALVYGALAYAEAVLGFNK